MYISTWPTLSPLLPFRRENSCKKPHPFYARHKIYGYLARGLIYHLARAMELAGKTVLVPDYHHGNEVRAFRAAGARLKFYRVKRDLTIDVEDLQRQTTPDVAAMLAIHYIGWAQPEIEKIAHFATSKNIPLIEDCALSLFAERADGRPIGTFGDHAIYCLYKTLPVPNGGLLVENKKPLMMLETLDAKLAPSGFMSTAGRALELILASIRMNADLAGKQLMALKQAAGNMLSAAHVERVPVGDDGFDYGNANLAISPLSLHLLDRIDLEEVAEKRRLRFEHLRNRLQGRTTFLDLDPRPGASPLFFPLLVEDKRSAVDALLARGIGAVEFWNKGDKDVDERTAQDARFLRSHLIELPIHQDVTTEQLDYIADNVLALGLGLGRTLHVVRPTPRLHAVGQTG